MTHSFFFGDNDNSKCNEHCVHISLYARSPKGSCLKAFIHKYGLNDKYCLMVYFVDDEFGYCKIYQGNFASLKRAVHVLTEYYSYDWVVSDIEGGSWRDAVEELDVETRVKFDMTHFGLEEDDHERY